MNYILPTGKVSMIIDMQFGSSGKGLLAQYLTENNQIDISVADVSPNAGHTFYRKDIKHVVRMLPVAGVLNESNKIYFPASSVIDLDILFEEIREYDINTKRINIHPRAAVVTKQDKYTEQHLVEISSTLTGTGGARSSKILRTNPLAQGTKLLQPFIDSTFNLTEMLNANNYTCLVETGQGFDLGLNEGFQYPYCTSRDVTPSQILANVNVHPNMLGKVCGVCRTFPIRVGNTEKGYSGDVYPDSKEITFNELGVVEEYSSVTYKKRRIFTFSYEQYYKVYKAIKPDMVLLNFCNYLKEDLKKSIIFDRKYCPTHVSYGPTTTNIRAYCD